MSLSTDRSALRLSSSSGVTLGGNGGDGGGPTPGGRYDDDNDVFNSGVKRLKMDNSALLPPEFFFIAESVDPSPDPYPSKHAFKVPNHPANEIEVLHQELAGAQTQPRAGAIKGTCPKGRSQGRQRYGRAIAAVWPRLEYEARI